MSAPQEPRLCVPRERWLQIGEELFGDDPRTWRFRCPACGHEQSHDEVKARKPDAGDTSQWIYFACEGRHNPGVGCDWTLGGLFKIHSLEVLDAGGVRIACMRFAHPRADELLTASSVALPEQPTSEARSWEEFSWPEWVPLGERRLVEDFWREGWGRGPWAYFQDLRDQRAPLFGAVVTLRRAGASGTATGRFVHRWNNIGAVILGDGTSEAVSW